MARFVCHKGKISNTAVCIVCMLTTLPVERSSAAKPASTQYSRLAANALFAGKRASVDLYVGCHIRLLMLFDHSAVTTEELGVHRRHEYLHVYFRLTLQTELE